MASFHQRARTHRLCVNKTFYAYFCLLVLNQSSHPPEPQCSYDPVEGLTLTPDIDPVEKVRQLEEEICSFFRLSVACCV